MFWIDAHEFNLQTGRGGQADGNASADHNVQDRNQYQTTQDKSEGN